MNEIINNICLVQYVTITNINSFDTDPVNQEVTIDKNGDWIDLDVAPGSELSILSSKTDTDDQYECALSSTVKSLAHIKEPVIIRLVLDSDEELIIGDDNIPVTLTESETNAGKSLSFSHTSWHKPFPHS
ncbi:MAG: hypothetical protein ABJG41_01415 [Cyclobacteriaceae bacterium]